MEKSPDCWRAATWAGVVTDIVVVCLSMSMSMSMLSLSRLSMHNFLSRREILENRNCAAQAVRMQGNDVAVGAARGWIGF